ncbi:MAG: hypothetical protein H7Y02_11710, partial [Candidatus Obscuribacterales bacterium]|nr:hypothetical protein [Steroidobacteraceae bacterium]
IAAAGGAWGGGSIFKFGPAVNFAAQGTPEPYDNGGGALPEWLLAVLLLLAAMKCSQTSLRRVPKPKTA